MTHTNSQSPEGIFRMLVVEPKPRDKAPAQSNSARAKQAGGGGTADLGDDIPFMMEWR